MENAAKALQIAGTVLVAILILVVLVKMAFEIGELQETKFKEQEEAQIVEFNEQYTQYSNQYVYGSIVRSLINKWESDKKVTVNIKRISGLEYNNSYPYALKDTQYFKCTGVEYNSLGYVNKINFKEIVVESSTPE